MRYVRVRLPPPPPATPPPAYPARGATEIIHDYFGVNLDVGWAAVEKDLPALRRRSTIFCESADALPRAMRTLAQASRCLKADTRLEEMRARAEANRELFAPRNSLSHRLS